MDNGRKVVPHYLGVFALTMLNIAAVLSLRGVPMIAATGPTMIFYIFFCTIFFFVPSALVAAELTTSCNQSGGVYAWVKSAFGARLGVIAVWLQWIQNIIWVPTVIAFGASCFAYSLDAPQLAKNSNYTALMVIFVYWAAIFITLRGIKLSSVVTTLGAILGTLLPGVFMIGLGVEWLTSGHTSDITVTSTNIFPDLSHFSNISFMAGILLLFAGMEVNAVHVKSLKNPSKDYPKAIFLSVLIILAIFFLASFSLSMIIPQKHISITAGIMQALEFILKKHHLLWLVKVLGGFISFGVVAGIIAWICGPSKGLLIAAENNDIPQFLSFKNRNGIQSHILIIQGIIVTILASLNYLITNVNEVYFLLTAMSASLYMIMYLMMFLSAIKLRYTMPNLKRPYKVPGGILGMWVICIISVASLLFSLICSFLPPQQLKIHSPSLYIFILVTGVLVFILIPFFLRSSKHQ